MVSERARVFGFDGFGRSSICSVKTEDILGEGAGRDVFQALFDPGGITIDEGAGDRRKADALAQQMRQDWLDLRDQSRDIDLNMEFGGEGGNAVNPYEQGHMTWFDPVEMADPGSSAYRSAESAYDPLVSAYSGFDPDSAGREMQLDATGYYRNLMDGGPDAVAEASYARARSQAEQRRRAASDAALRAAEARGMAGGGEALLAELVNSQGMATDLYQAGLERSALEQGRRDAAAGAYGQAGAQLYGQDVGVEATRAGGLDTFATNRAAGRDAMTTNRAAGLDAWQGDVNQDRIDLSTYNADRQFDARNQNTGRLNTVLDTNTALENQTNQWNTVGAPQQKYNWLSGALSGATGAGGGQLSQMNMNAQQPGYFETILPIVKEGAKAYATGGASMGA